MDVTCGNRLFTKRIMRHIVYMHRLAYAILGLILLASCNNIENKKPKVVDELRFQTIVKDTTVRLLPEDDAPTLNIHLSMPFVSDTNSDAINEAIIHGRFLTPDYMGLMSQSISTQQAVDSFITQYAKDYQRDYAPLYRNDRLNKSSYEITYECEAKIESHRKGIVVYIARNTISGGGAHDVTTTIAKNLETKTGKTITLEDIFSEGYEQPLTDLIVKKLCEQQKVQKLAEIQKIGFFNGIEPYVTDNFIWDEDKVTFIYTDSEVAPHEMGEQRVSIPEEELKTLLK